MNLESRSESHFQEQIGWGEEPDYKGEPTMVDKVVGRDQANSLEIKSVGKEPIRLPQLLPKETKKALKCGTSPALQLGLHPIDCALKICIE